jgi:hypothetical protein
MSQARKIELFKIHIVTPDGMQLSRDFQIAALQIITVRPPGSILQLHSELPGQNGVQQFLHEVPATGKKVS